ncbi:endospore germination permease [Ureibacillus sp. 179-F W5.1 NHS]|uniref:Spore gernimation protein n=1 Tax=Lysinibacillus halotolerans TaxID=1368476 RepID=A0A3M8HDA1_9BACI|nr:endospore germination permease [Lysinibacillus halotolerans]RND00367.1 spore gernimation protein [Lysinibacillus halotolerans]
MGKISLLHVVFLVMTFIGLKNHVTILPPILETAKRDGWASVILAAFIIFPLLFLIIYIQNKSNQQPMKQWLREKIGPTGSTILLYSIVIFLLISAAFTMRETILWISATFLPQTPPIFLLTIYIILCFLLVSKNILTIVIVNGFVLFFVVIFGFFVAITNLQVKDYSYLLPLFENGFTPIAKSIFFPASGFIELFLLLFLHHYFKQKMKWYHLAIMLFILMGLTLGPLMGAITLFGPEEAAKQRYPAFEEWGLVSIGAFITHMDFLSIYQWLTGTFIRVGLLLFIAADILNITEDSKKIWSYMMPPFFIINLILYLLDDNLFFKLNTHDFLIITFVYFLLLSLLIGAVALISNRQNKNKVRSPKNKTESSES